MFVRSQFIPQATQLVLASALALGICGCKTPGGGLLRMHWMDHLHHGRKKLHVDHFSPDRFIYYRTAWRPMDMVVEAPCEIATPLVDGPEELPPPPAPVEGLPTESNSPDVDREPETDGAPVPPLPSGPITPDSEDATENDDAPNSSLPSRLLNPPDPAVDGETPSPPSGSFTPDIDEQSGGGGASRVAPAGDRLPRDGADMPTAPLPEASSLPASFEGQFESDDKPRQPPQNDSLVLDGKGQFRRDDRPSPPLPGLPSRLMSLRADENDTPTAAGR